MIKPIIIVIAVFIAGCEPKLDVFDRNIVLCEESGGIPIISIWDGVSLADCKFPVRKVEQ